MTDLQTCIRKEHTGDSPVWPPAFQLVETDRGGNRIWVYREDLNGHERGLHVCGNKYRIIGRMIEDCKEKKCDVIVGYGGPQSDLISALSYLAARNGIPCHIIETVRTDTWKHSTNHRLAEIYGARIHYCLKNEAGKTVRCVLRALKASGYRPYYIFGDAAGRGNRAVAVEAYKDTFTEIAAWEKRTGHRVDHIFIAAGTGISQAGLIAGMRETKGYRPRITGISVSHSARQVKKDILNCLQQYYSAKNHTDVIFSAVTSRENSDIHVEDAWLAGGYGRYDARICQTIEEVYRRSGIRLDPIYTGKAYTGMKEYLRSRGITGRNILFIHTGGLPNYFDYAIENGRIHYEEILAMVPYEKERLREAG